MNFTICIKCKKPTTLDINGNCSICGASQGGKK